MQRHARDVVAGPTFGAARRDDAGAFGLDKFDAARIRESFFGRVDDLNQRAMRARCGQSDQHASDLRHRRPEIRQHDDFGQRRRDE